MAPAAHRRPYFFKGKWILCTCSARRDETCAGQSQFVILLGTDPVALVDFDMSQLFDGVWGIGYGFI